MRMSICIFLIYFGMSVPQSTAQPFEHEAIPEDRGISLSCGRDNPLKPAPTTPASHHQLPQQLGPSVYPYYPNHPLFPQPHPNLKPTCRAKTTLLNKTFSGRERIRSTSTNVVVVKYREREGDEEKKTKTKGVPMGTAGLREDSIRQWGFQRV